MIESEFVRDVVEMNLEGEKFNDLLFEQIDLLTIRETEHTGIGCYYHFDGEPGIEKFKLNPSQLEQLFGKHLHRIENVSVINKEINMNALATVHLTDGVIDCLEIWNKVGGFPEEELLTYQLKRI